MCFRFSSIAKIDPGMQKHNKTKKMKEKMCLGRVRMGETLDDQQHNFGSHFLSILLFTATSFNSQFIQKSKSKEKSVLSS